MVSQPWPSESADAPESSQPRTQEIALAVDASGTIEIPGDLTEQTGVLSAVVVAGSGVGRATVDVLPGRAVDGIVPLAGPRSMIADAAHWTMVTAFPVDRYGNAMSDGTNVQLTVRRPAGNVELIDTTVEHLLAGVRVFSGVKAGRSTIRIDVDGATGPEVEVLEVPGPPVEVQLLEPDLTLRADGRMLVTIATAPLADAFGNVLLDGTAASAGLDGPSGTGTATAVTIDGRAEFIIEAPPTPGPVRLRAVVDGVLSEVIELDFVTAVGDLPVTASRVDVDGVSLVRIDVGPVTTDLGGFVPDGTVVSVSGVATPVSVDLRDGVASLTVDAAPGDDLILDVLGVSVRVVAP